MRVAARCLVVVVALAQLVIAGCNDHRDARAAGEAARDRKAALAVASATLEAYKAHDWPELVTLARPSVRNYQPDLAEAIEKNFTDWRQQSIDAWDGTPPAEVRFAFYKGNNAQATEAMAPYADLGGGELAVVRLVFEAGHWRFDKLVKPTRAHYEAMASSVADAVKAYEARGDAGAPP